MFIPDQQNNQSKIILLASTLRSWSIKSGRDVFLSNKCPVNSCTVTDNRDWASKADLVLHKDVYNPVQVGGAFRSPNQIHMIYYLECPFNTLRTSVGSVFNWTATYRRDSDIVTPYAKWVYYDEKIKQKEQQDRNYATNKTKKVAWFVSNCEAHNKRMEYAMQLVQYIRVDIYGLCNGRPCERGSKECFEMLDRDYKFYLSFENSNCVDYITEKLFVNALGWNVLPIVMGARLEDYEAVAPYKSFIHVDQFESPKELAEYLHELDRDELRYNEYFKWKGTGEFINTFFWCRICAMLHSKEGRGGIRKSYEDLNEWWSGPGVCTSDS